MRVGYRTDSGSGTVKTETVVRLYRMYIKYLSIRKYKADVKRITSGTSFKVRVFVLL